MNEKDLDAKSDAARRRVSEKVRGWRALWNKAAASPAGGDTVALTCELGNVEIDDLEEVCALASTGASFLKKKREGLIHYEGDPKPLPLEVSERFVGGAIIQETDRVRVKWSALRALIERIKASGIPHGDALLEIDVTVGKILSARVVLADDEHPLPGTGD